MSRTQKPRLSNGRRHSGLAMVEMALVLPLLILVMAGIVQFGGMFFLQNKMLNLARDAARRLAVGEITSSEAQSLISAGLSAWTVTPSTTIHIPVPNDPVDNDIEVTVTVPKAQASLMDIFGMFQSGNIVAKVVMRQEAV